MKIIIFIVYYSYHLITRIETSKIDSLLPTYLFQSSKSSNQNDSLSYLINTLKEYQLSTLKHRNYECLFRDYKAYENFRIKFEPKSVNQTYLTDLLNDYLDDHQRNLDNTTTTTNNFIDYMNNTCINIDEFVKILPLNSENANDRNVNILLQLVLVQTLNNGCNFCAEVKVEDKVSRFDVWLYGIIFVTIINLSSLVGAIVIPCTNKQFYKKVLMFLIALAIGSLAGSGFIHLIPQAHGITEDPRYALNHEYVWKGLAIMAGSYLFYLVERIMKILISLRRNRVKRSKSLKKSSNNQSTMFDSLENLGYVKAKDQPVDLAVEMRTQILRSEELQPLNHTHGHSHTQIGKDDLTLVAPVAWMIIFGDGLHNFIDGLSIGAGLTESIFKGISICIAVICEEFPHELGDFAILINAGMSYKQALLFNGLSACCCYVGLIIGIILGENLHINQWIYAVAGGMFLYISLCDMIPELNETSNELEETYLKQLNSHNASVEALNNENTNNNNNNTTNEESVEVKMKLINVESAITFYKFKLLFIQNFGIIIGFTVMLIMARYGKTIEIKQ